MNMYFVYADGHIVTPEPPARSSRASPARRSSSSPEGGPPGRGAQVLHRRVARRRASGEITEVFACGTAAVVTPVGTLKWAGGEVQGSTEAGELTMQIRQALVDIQYGRADDTFGWMHRVV